MSNKDENDNIQNNDAQNSDAQNNIVTINNDWNAYYTVLGILAGIVIWIAIWQLAEVFINKKDKYTQLKIYGVAVIISLIVLFWLAANHPSNLSSSGN